MENNKEIALKWCLNRYRQVKGRPCNIDNPKAFTEKLQWKKFNDPNPLYTITSDKLGVYKYLKAVNSPITPPPLLQHTKDPKELILTGYWILKANHGSGWNIKSSDGLSTKQVRDKARTWLSQRYAPLNWEWGYQNIEPELVLQELVPVQAEYKFYVFSGKAEYVAKMDYVNGRTASYYDMDWNKAVDHWVDPCQKLSPKPANFDELKAIAEKLGVFDFARIDLMISDDKIYLSEITHYPTSGFSVMKPDSFDFEIGKQWIPQL